MPQAQNATPIKLSVLGLSAVRRLALLLAATALAALSPSAALAGWPDVGEEQRVGGGSRDSAVVVGIERYAFVQDVPGARRNARDWQRWLSQSLI